MKRTNTLFVIHPQGTNQIYYKNPNMVAWWSAALPGFGHILIGQYIKGLALFLWEIVVNMGSKLNMGLVATLDGRFDQTSVILDPNWILLYIPVFLFAIWDSYRCAVDVNQTIDVIQRNYTPNTVRAFGISGVNVFTKKKPIMALIWSFFSPGAGQFYMQKLIEAIFFMIWFIAISYFSHTFEAVLYLLNGNITLANHVIDIQWFMYLPSIIFFSAYNAYSDALETNIIYEFNQTTKYQKQYQNTHFKVEFPD